MKNEIEVKNITNKIISYVNNIEVLCKIQDNALEEDLIKNNLDNSLEITQTVEKTIKPLKDKIEIQILNLHTLYINSSEEERSIIKNNLLTIIEEHSEIKPYMENFIEKIN